jgi:vacuolar-type H+-ATPase subunit F/Vma7
MTAHPSIAPASLRIVAGTALAAGFRLTGVVVDEVGDGREAAAVIDRLAGNGRTGILLVQQDLYDALPEAHRRALERAPLPIIVPIPPARWTDGAGDAASYLLDLLQRAIGYRVRLQ